jgi:hypothetical protein
MRHYFTTAQINDPTWEAKRLQSLETLGYCEGGKRVIRRDVRWFAATPGSQRACAAVVYTVKCDIPTSVIRDGFEIDRRDALEGELPSPIERGCGGKDWTRMPASDPYIRAYEKIRSHFVDREVCNLQSPTLDAPLELTPATRMVVRYSVDRALAARFASTAFDNRLTSIVETAVGSGLFRANKISGIFPASGVVSDNSANIRAELSIGLNKGGRPYCVQLTARQGNRVWRRTIERTAPLDGQPLGLFTFPKTDVPTAGDDASALADALRASLGLPAATAKP